MSDKASLWTVGQVLAQSEELAARRPEELAPTRNDLLWALAEVLGLGRLELLMQHDRPMSGAERQRFRGMLSRLLAGEPLAYVLGHQDFYGRSFLVGPEVLIPRPETEELVRIALELLPQGARVFEPCTGSGCIGLTLVLEREDLSVLSSDLSREALEYARKNARALGADPGRFRLRQGEWWQAAQGECFDALVANPPYVDPARPELLAESVRRYEPGLALFAEEGRPLSAYEALLQGAVTGLAHDALVFFEAGIDSIEPLCARVSQSRNFSEAEILLDLAGKARILRCRRT
ncbi:MAG: protein-(glutamine-N5) methyltransferase, release factor-specific [Planctomycetota bacterium]|nr:MAG: protein-(glutamine-N5) methyltransferase, release factor-specific [Planctomycetota bacterium]